MNQKKLANKRKFKFGIISVVLSLVVIAAILAVNVIFSALAYSKNWYVDLTAEKLYELSDSGREQLDTIEENITVHFCAPFDKLQNNELTNMVFNLVKEISADYDNISYDYIDFKKTPSALEKYKSTENTVITESSVIVECENGSFRTLNLANMFMYEDESYQTPWAFNGEQKIILAMLQCVQVEAPIAYFTNTHGETVSEGLAQLFYDCGYILKPINLAEEDFEDDGRVIVISSPKYDFEGISELTEGRMSEIEKLDSFLDNFGSVMVFMDPGVQELPELEAFLEEWGIAFEDAKLKDTSNSEGGDVYTLVGAYSVEEGRGGDLVGELISGGTPPKTIIKDARPIKLLWETSSSGRAASTAIYSSKTAERHSDDGSVETGMYPLVTVSHEIRYIDNTPHSAYVFAVGSGQFASDQALKPSYANSYIIYTMMREMGKTAVPLELKLKVFESNELSITTAEARTWTWITVVILPVCITAIGAVVHIRRKHR